MERKQSRGDGARQVIIVLLLSVAVPTLTPAITRVITFGGAVGFAVPGPRGVKVNLAVYNLIGQEVAVLVDAVKTSGVHTITFDATGLSSGVYLYTLTADGFSLSRSMAHRPFYQHLCYTVVGHAPVADGLETWGLFTTAGSRNGDITR